jgi:hypothetical protein
LGLSPFGIREPHSGDLFVAKALTPSPEPRNGDLFVAKALTPFPEPHSGDLFVAKALHHLLSRVAATCL